jgi:hypothetical protein
MKMHHKKMMEAIILVFSGEFIHDKETNELTIISLMPQGVTWETNHG